MSTAKATPAILAAAITRCLSEGRSNNGNSFSIGRVSTSNGIGQPMTSHTHTYDTAQATAGKRAMSPCGFMPEATHAKAMTAPQAASRISHATPTPKGKRHAMPDQNPHSHRKATFAPCAKAANLPRSSASRNVDAPGTADDKAGSAAPGVTPARSESEACPTLPDRKAPSIRRPGWNPGSCAQPASEAESPRRISPAPRAQPVSAARDPLRKSTGHPTAYMNAARIAPTDPNRSAGSNAVAWATTSRTDWGTPCARDVLPSVPHQRDSTHRAQGIQDVVGGIHS